MAAKRFPPPPCLLPPRMLLYLIQHTVVKCHHPQTTALGEPGAWTDVDRHWIAQIIKQSRLGASFGSFSFHKHQPNIPSQPQEEVFSQEPSEAGV